MKLIYCKRWYITSCKLMHMSHCKCILPPHSSQSVAITSTIHSHSFQSWQLVIQIWTGNPTEPVMYNLHYKVSRRIYIVSTFLWIFCILIQMKSMSSVHRNCATSQIVGKMPWKPKSVMSTRNFWKDIGIILSKEEKLANCVILYNTIAKQWAKWLQYTVMKLSE